MPFICLPSRHPKLLSGALCLELLIWPAVCSCNTVCFLCSLPWWISVFDTTNKAFHFDGIQSWCSHTGWSLCFFSARQSCLLGLWVELRDRLRQTKKKKLSLAGRANPRHHLPLLKSAASTVHWFRLRTQHNHFAKLSFPCMISWWYNSITLTSNPFRNNWSLILIEQRVSSHFL